MKPSIAYKMTMLFFVTLSLLITTQPGVALNLKPALTQDSANLNFCITDIPITGNFPNVNVNFRVFDQALNPVNNISDQDLRVSENGQTAVPTDTGMQSNAQGLGVDFYFVIDRGNRTDQSLAKTILDLFVSNFNDSKDTAKIVVDDGNVSQVYFPSPTNAKLSVAIANFSTAKVGSPRFADEAVRSVLNDINSNFNTCQRAKILFLVVGDDAITKELTPEIVQGIRKSFTKLIVFHVANPRDGSFGSRTYYEQMAIDSGGQYVQILSTGDMGRSVFNTISSYRQSYTASYRTQNGFSGSHDITFFYKGTNIPTKGSNTYTVTLLQPIATLVAPTSVERTAKQLVNTGYVYSETTKTISVKVDFPDGFRRNISPKGTLVISRSGQGDLRLPITLVPTSDASYQFAWDLASVGDQSRSDLALKVELVDELALTFVSQDTPVMILNHIPLSLMTERYLVYIMSGIVFLLVVALIVMWRRLGNLAVRGREAISNVAGAVRKTIMGGGKKAKPLASLKIIDGPPSMINQELKIFSESVKLGRDPQKADMTFYAPDANSSISGLHARIEKVNGAWRIVALSQSGSETFVDDTPIPFNEPQPLQSGKIIRLGYLAQQPVVFTFTSEVSSQVVDAPRITEVDYRKTQVDGVVRADPINISSDRKEALKQSSKDSTDDIFDEFRDR